MTARLTVSQAALADLERIRNWLGDHASATVAADQIDRITDTFRRLREFPRLGRGPSDQLRRKSVRDAPFIIFYRVTSGGITILRMRHDREDRPE